MSLDCRKCGAVIDDVANTGRCRYCATPYREMPAAPSFAAAPSGHAVLEVASIGDNKIAVIAALRSGLGSGLKEAKDISDQKCPFHVSVDRARAELLATELTRAGARVRVVG